MWEATDVSQNAALAKDGTWPRLRQSCRRLSAPNFQTSQVTFDLTSIERCCWLLKTINSLKNAFVQRCCWLFNTINSFTKHLLIYWSKSAQNIGLIYFNNYFELLCKCFSRFFSILLACMIAWLSWFEPIICICQSDLRLWDALGFWNANKLAGSFWGFEILKHLLNPFLDLYTPSLLKLN